MAGYIRQDVTDNIANGREINAEDFDNEFDAIVTAFNSTTGHTHGGGTDEGAPITVVGPSQDVVVTGTTVLPKATDVVSLGSVLKKFKDLVLSGTATATTFIGNLTGNVTGSVTGNSDTATKLATARTISLSGDATGSVSFDGSENATIVATVVDDSHSHDTQYYTKAAADVIYTGKAATTTTITAGSGLTGGGSLATDRVISHADTSTQASLNNLSGVVIQDVTLDTYGHVTGLGTLDLDTRYFTGSEVSSFLATKVDKITTITAGGGLTGGGSLEANRTISHANTSNQASLNNSSGVVIQDVTLDTYGHVTALGTANLDTRYALLSQTWPGVYTGSSSSNLTFPVGTTLLLNSRSRTRNSTVTVRLSTDTSQYIDSGTGSVLTGTWAIRGDTIYSDHGQLVQRIS